ncbi:LamG domain-containing protein [uncultured Flavobacterium sp.]|uniref:LamG domain-containing protein n=1 Tax=uncultured Flavobacterium sp. TaxID=165435 RepID=UPI0025F652A0|nr:LamG domain-containing protein [uncultured Flavobacterium sp.]
MIVILRYVFFIALCAFFTVSCQDDAVEEDNSGTLGTGSALTARLIAIAGDHDTDGCISISYPVTIFGYNSGFQVEETYIINNDEELHALLQAFNADEYYSVNYPVTIIVNGQTVALNTNQQLELAINAALAACGTDECDNPAVLTGGLIMYMTFAGGAITDLTGNAVSAPAGIGAAADRDGTQNCAVAFNGQQYLHIPSQPSNALVQGDAMSISLWFKMQNTVAGNLEYLFRKGNANGQGLYLTVYDMNTPMVGMPGTEAWDSSWNQDPLLWEDTQNWHHLVATLDAGNTLRLYRNGILRATQATSGNIGDNALDYYIGQGFTGLLDDLRVYKRELSQQEVQTLYELEGDCSICLE